MDLSSSIKNCSIALAAVFAIIYYCETFCCSYCSYFSHLSDAAKSYEDIDKMFKSSPLVTMNVVCYHYRQVHHSHGTGRNRTSSSSTEKVVTHRSSQEFKYSSWRDISGEFKLDTSGAMKDENIAYVLLDLSLDVQFASDGTADDYSRARLDFINRNRYDRYQDYSQINTIPNFHEHFLIQVTDQVPCLFGQGYFIIFGLLTFNAFYSTYVDCFCQRQKFMIKKVVSTRQNLNAPELQNQYAYYDPRMQMANQMVVFAPDQGPQVYGISQPIPQQYANIQQAPSQLLFVAMPQGNEVFQSPEGVPPLSNGQLSQTSQRGIYQEQQVPHQIHPQVYQG
jgi:hypothetical protein